MAQTIAAVATARGSAGLSVIRISGDTAIETAARIFRPADGSLLTDTEGYRAKFGHIYLDGEKTDDAVALVFRAPKSYTGEDVCELSIHGGLYLTDRVLHAVFEAGAMPAGPGEFTKRAFLNGKMDLAQAESVAGVISAASEEQARLSYGVLEGRLSKKIKDVCDALTGCSALMGAWVDYPDEDIPELERGNLTETLRCAKETLEELLKHYDGAKVIAEGADTVICGRPNAGKSTLMNLLAGEEKSIVTDIRGTTRDIVEVSVRFAGTVLRLYDTAGIRESDDTVEAIGIARAMQKIKQARLVLAVFDSSDALDDDDLTLIETLKGRDAIAIINKTDLPEKTDEALLQNSFSKVVRLSAKNGSGLQDLEDAVRQTLHTDRFDATGENLINERQRIDCAAAAESVAQALEDAENGVTYDAVGVMIDDAIDALLRLTGQKATEEVVNNIFSQFCVGK